MSKIIAMYVPTLAGGGAEKVFVNLANYFQESGHTIYLFNAYGKSYK